MSYVKRFRKHPGETIDYDFLFGEWLAARDDAVLTYTITKDAGLTVDSSFEDGSTIRAFISGGAAGRSYLVVATVVTVGGRVKIGQILVRVRGRAVYAA